MRCCTNRSEIATKRHRTGLACRMAVAACWLSLAPRGWTAFTVPDASAVSQKELNNLSTTGSASGSPGLSLKELEEFRTTGIPDAQWPALLGMLGHEDERAAVLELIKDQHPFPAGKLVELLTSGTLGVRLGALDLLEDTAGDTFGFDPWQDLPASGGNVEALGRWKAWLANGAKGTQAQAVGMLNDETFRALALEIMSGESERSERAMQRLDEYGLAAISHIETFFKSEPMLEAGPRAALKAAEYRVVLLQTMPKQADALARDLALGRPEIQANALSTLGGAGPGVLPVIADFLASPDPLVRETAVDAAFDAGQAQAVGMIVERLKTENAESVLHAMLRGLGQHGTEQAHADAIARFLNHPSENVVISALEALGANQAGDVSAALGARLDDPRWRVRAAALDTIGKRKVKALAPKVTQCIQDSDLFVRVSAVQALLAVDQSDSFSTLAEQFARQDDLKAPILQAFFSSDTGHPPDAVWDALAKAPPAIILQCLDTLEDRMDEEGKRVPYAARFVLYPNPDVSAAALRLLASRGRYTALLLAALKSSDLVKQDAVLDELHLPQNFLTNNDDNPGGDSAPAAPAPNPILSRLFDLIVGSTSRPGAGNSGGTADEAQAPAAEMRAVLNHFLKEGSPRQRFCAAVVLTGQSDVGAAQFLLGQLDTLSGLDRRSIANALHGVEVWPEGPIMDLAQRLLRDPEDDVREQSIDAWLQTKKPERLGPLLAEFSRPGSNLNADDLYGWELDRLAQTPGAKKPIFDWARATLDDTAAPDSHKVLAIILLTRSGQVAEAHLDPLLIAPGPWLRRAAYRALGLAAAKDHLDQLLNDDSALVRGALPFLALPHNQGWQHWFDDTHHVDDVEDFNRNSPGQSFGAWSQQSPLTADMTPEVLSGLEKLTHDPSDMVRFEAEFALLRLGHPVEPTAFAALIAAQPSDTRARERLGTFLENNYGRLGKSYGVLVPLATDISESNMPQLLAHFDLQNATGFTSFAALAKVAPASSHPADVSVAPEAIAAPAPAAAFRVIFFYKPGCRDCARVLDMLNRHAPDFPTMVLDERNIDDSRDALLDEVLSARFRVKDTLRQVTPAVFTQAGQLVSDDITFPRLGDLLRKSSAIHADPNWAHVAAAETAGARQTITHRYEALSFGVVAAAGLLDGINPCAFATIVFLLSYLQVARRGPREILAVGVAFVAAVFLSFFLIGLGMAQVLEQIAALNVAGMLLNYALAGFALVVAVLSFHDAQLAARGELGEMTLQLPGVLKEQIRGVIRVGARASHFVPSAFVAGVAVSFLGLPCTGQVYLPTILYMLRAGHAGAVRHLLFYNTAFIVPLVIVFLLAWAGLRSDALLRFQEKHISLVKVLTGLLFLLLTGFLLFGHLLIPQLAIGR